MLDGGGPLLVLLFKRQGPTPKARGRRRSSEGTHEGREPNLVVCDAGAPSEGPNYWVRPLSFSPPPPPPSLSLGP